MSRTTESAGFCSVRTALILSLAAAAALIMGALAWCISRTIAGTLIVGLPTFFGALAYLDIAIEKDLKPEEQP